MMSRKLVNSESQQACRTQKTDKNLGFIYQRFCMKEKLKHMVSLIFTALRLGNLMYILFWVETETLKSSLSEYQKHVFNYFFH